MSFDQFYIIAVKLFKAIVIKNIDAVIFIIGITAKIFVQLLHILI